MAAGTGRASGLRAGVRKPPKDERAGVVRRYGDLADDPPPVHQIAKAPAVEWAEAGVRVDAVAPGYTATSQTELLRTRPDLRESCLSTTPMGRFADPVEIAAAVLFLASNAAGYCTGTILTVDGGHTCW